MEGNRDGDQNAGFKLSDSFGVLEQGGAGSSRLLGSFSLCQSFSQHAQWNSALEEVVDLADLGLSHGSEDWTLEPSVDAATLSHWDWDSRSPLLLGHS